MTQPQTKQMLGGCGVCTDERGWKENPLVYCDGDDCNVAVHKNCYGITKVSLGAFTSVVSLLGG